MTCAARKINVEYGLDLLLFRELNYVINIHPLLKLNIQNESLQKMMLIAMTNMNSMYRILKNKN